MPFSLLLYFGHLFYKRGGRGVEYIAGVDPLPSSFFVFSGEIEPPSFFDIFKGWKLKLILKKCSIT